MKTIVTSASYIDSLISARVTSYSEAVINTKALASAKKHFHKKKDQQRIKAKLKLNEARLNCYIYGKQPSRLHRFIKLFFTFY